MRDQGAVILLHPTPIISLSIGPSVTENDCIIDTCMHHSVSINKIIDMCIIHTCIKHTLIRVEDEGSYIQHVYGPKS